MTQNDTPRKSALLACVCVFMVLVAQAQVVSISDPKFKAALLENPDINTNGDDQIQVSEAEAYTGQINVAGKDINSLNGIEAFINLTDLRIHYNNVISLDVSANTALEKLHMQNNQISHVYLGANTELEMLRAQNNDLTELVLTANTNLRYLEAQNNQLTKLNIKNGNNTAMYAFHASGNPDLACVQVDDAAYASDNWSDNVDTSTSFSTDCDYPTGEVVHIPDQNFKNALLANASVNTNGDGEIQVSEAERIQSLDVSGEGISDLTGINSFVGLHTLDCSNNNLTTLNLEPLRGLKNLYCQNNQLTFLEFRSDADYETWFDTGDFEALDATGNPDLSCVEVYNVRYFQNNFSDNIDPGAVFSADCDGDDAADVVYIPDPVFKDYLLSNFNRNGDDEIQRSELEPLDVVQMDVSGMSISDLTGIEVFTDIEWLDCSDNNLTFLNVSTLQAGDLYIDCSHNQISEVSYSPHIYGMDLSYNNLTSFTLDGYFFGLFLNNNNLSSLTILDTTPEGIFSGEGFNAKNNPDLECVEVHDPAYYENNFSDSVDEGVVYSTDCPGNEPVVHIPDQNFKDALLADEDINTNGDDEIQVSETEGVTLIDVSGNSIADLTGVEEFAELLQLTVHDNNLTTLDVSGMGLDYLGVNNNRLTSLNLGGIVEYLDAERNHLSCIQTSNPDYYEENPNVNVDEGVNFSTDCNYGSGTIVYIPDPAFKEFMVAGYDNDGNGEIQTPDETQYIFSLDVSGLGISDLTGVEYLWALEAFDCSDNNITRIDTRFGMEDMSIDCSNNQIEEIIVSDNLSHLDISNNLLTSFTAPGPDGAGMFIELDVSYNQLVALDISSSDYTLDIFDARGNPDLTCIEVESPENAEAQWSDTVDEGVIFSTDCSSEEPVVHIPDQNFKDALLADEDINTNGDDEIQVSETEGITKIDASGAGVTDPTGVMEFPQLVQLNFDDNNLTSLDVTDMGLTSLSVSNNELHTLVLGPVVEYLYAPGNPDLTCIQTDGPDYYDNDHGWGEVDEGVVFSTDCKYGEPVVSIPDQNFKDALLADEDINTNGDDEIQVSETEGITEIDATGYGVTDITGVEEFNELLSLTLHSNNLTELDVTTLGLDYLGVNNNQLATLKLGGIVEYLDAVDNNLTCIETSSPEYYEGNPNVNVDEGVVFSTDCPETEPVVYIPDQNFKDALLADEDINTNGDDEIQASEAEAFTGQINVAGQNIADLTGIEAFTMLTDLRVHYNNLTTFDVSANTALKKLHFQNNQVNNLDLSVNTELDMIRAQNNDLMKLYLSANSKLRYLEVQNNSLTELNIQNGNNTAMYSFSATGNPSLECIQVDDVSHAEANWSDDIDEGASFSTDCGYSSGEVVYIPDQNFKNALLADEAININGDDEIQVSETEGVLDIDVSGNSIGDLTGVDAFNELLRLTAHNNNLTALDITALGLDYLGVNDNQLTSLKFTGIIEYLDAINNDLTCIETTNPDYYYEGDPNVNVDEGVVFSTDCSSAEPVVYIPDENFKAVLLASDINSNGDDEIQYSETEGIPYIYVGDQNISDLTGIEAFTDMEFLDCSGNNLASLDLSSNSRLVILDCGDNALTHLDLTANTILNELYASNNALEELLLPNSYLQYIYAEHNNLSFIDVTMVIGLEILNLDDNSFETLDVSSTGALLGLYVSNNNLTMLNVQNGNNINMYDFYAAGNPLGCVQVDDVSDAEAYWGDNVDPGAYFSLDCSSGEPMIVHIPDANFKNALLANDEINTNGDDEIQVSEAEAYTGKIQATGAGVADITGIEAFINVTDLRVNYNNLTSVDLSSNTHLRQLHLQNNNLTSIDLSANTELQMVRLQFNAISSLDVSNLSSLDYLEVSHNQLSSLDVSGLADLDHLDCQGNDITSLTFSSNNQLHTLWCNHNQLASIDLSGAPNLATLIIAYNNLTSLDLSNNVQLVEVAAFNNDLTDINLSGLDGLTDLAVYINELTALDIQDNIALERVDAGFNNIAALDVSNNPALIDLNIRENALTSLDVSNNPNLNSLIIPFNQLESLNMKNGNNTALQDFSAEGNPSLECIQVDDVAYAEANWRDDVDAGANFSTDCTGTMARTGQEDDEQLLAGGATAEEVIIYPVPTENELTVRAGTLAENTELFLFDTEGQQFYREVMPAGGNADITLDLRQMNLSSGVYYIRLVNGESTITKKFIKK